MVRVWILSTMLWVRLFEGEKNIYAKNWSVDTGTGITQFVGIDFREKKKIIYVIITMKISDLTVPVPTFFVCK